MILVCGAVSLSFARLLAHPHTLPVSLILLLGPLVQSDKNDIIVRPTTNCLVRTNRSRQGT